MATEIPPVPYKSKMLDSNGVITSIWGDWFRKVFTRLGGNIADSNAELKTAIKDSEMVSTARIEDGAVSFAKLLQSDWARVLAPFGNHRFPSGFRIQWGFTGSVSSGAVGSVSFPTAFPTACLFVICGIQDNAAVPTSATGQVGTGGQNPSGFEIYNRTSVAHSFNWIAVGY